MGAVVGIGGASARRSKRHAPRDPAAIREPAPPHSINLLELPSEMLLAVLSGY